MKKIIPLKVPKENLEYILVKDALGIGWLYPANSPHPADNIYCTDSPDWAKVGQGFGGSTLKLPLYGGKGIFELRGGWHSNPNHLLSKTGIDLTEKAFTRCMIALKYVDDQLDDLIVDDGDWVVGNHYRGEKIAQRLANDLGQPVYCYSQTCGGSSSGWYAPDDTVSK